MLYQADLIPHYQGTGMGIASLFRGNISNDTPALEGDILIDTVPSPLNAQEALALDQYGGAVLQFENANRYFSSYTRRPSQKQEWTPEDVAKGMQDYLVCIEMFAFAIIHIFVFSHTEYDPQAVEARRRSLMQQPHKDWNKRLGRKWKEWDNKSAWSGTTRSFPDWNGLNANPNHLGTSAISTGTLEEDDLLHHPLDSLEERSRSVELDDDGELPDQEHKPLLATTYDCHNDENESLGTVESSELNDKGLHSDGDSTDEDHDEENPLLATSIKEEKAWTPRPAATKTGFVKALWDSAIPQDLRDNTVGIIKGDYVVEKKTLLHHAATSDSYNLFARFNKPRCPGRMSEYREKVEDVR